MFVFPMAALAKARESEEDDEEDAIDLETEILSSMYPDELTIVETKGGHEVRFSFQFEGDFVRVLLNINVIRGRYPESTPDLDVDCINLAEEHRKRLSEELLVETKELQGELVCSTLAQISTDFLRKHDIPPRCSIC